MEKRIRVVFQYVEDNKVVYQTEVSAKDHVVRGAHIEVLYVLTKTKLLSFWQFLVQMDKIDLFNLKDTR